MKAKNLFFGALACLAFAACSNDDDAVKNPSAEGNGDKYIVVNIAVPGTATRAQYDDENNPNPDSQKEYEDGTEAENNIKDALFVFFDEGKKVTQCYYTDNIESTTSSTNETPYVERISKVILALDAPNPNPAYVLAVVNVPSTLAKNDAFTVENSIADVLDDIASKYQEEKSSTKYFVMSSSVFNNNQGLTKIEPKHLQKYEYEADGTTKKDPDLNNATVEANSVDIFVERVAARVDATAKELTIQASSTGNSVKYQVYNSSTKVFEEQTVTIEPVLQGVHLSYTSNMSYLIKQYPTTGNTWPTGKTWDDATNMRSFWAASVPTTTTDFKWDLQYWSNRTDGIGSTVLAKGDDNEVSIYSHENTTSYNGSSELNAQKTKLVITAKLKVSVSGTEKPNASLVKYMTQLYLYEDFKYRVNADALEDYYWNNSGVKSNDWTKWLTLERVNPTKNPAYTVKPAFMANETDFPTKLYKKNSDGTSYDEITELGTTSDASNTDLATYLEEAISKVMTTDIWCWQNGKTYYYVDINHLNETQAIVRNHIYQLNLKTITGLGTPVFWPVVDDNGTPEDPDDDEPGNGDDPKVPTDPIPDPDQPIDPEKPEDEAFYVTCQLNVLKWRLVGQQNVEIGW